MSKSRTRDITRSDLPDTESIRTINLPDDRIVRWSDIMRNYREQMRGQGYTKERRENDIREMRSAFERLATAAKLHELGYRFSEISRVLGVSDKAVSSWLVEGRMPQKISFERHKYHQRSRKQITLNGDPHALGYVLGAHAIGAISSSRNKTSAAARFSLRTVDPTVSKAAKAEFERAVGIKPRITAGRLYLDSAELAKTLSDLGTQEKISQTLPDDPKARLGFARAIVDLGRMHVIRYNRVKYSGPSMIKLIGHSGKVSEVLRQSLKEQGIRYRSGTLNGLPTINISRKEIPKFKQTIGFRKAAHRRI